jgi:hypothetical protein
VAESVISQQVPPTRYIIIIIIMALQPFAWLWPLLQFPNLFYTVGRTPWTSDQSVARPLPTHRINAHNRHPYLEWDSNPRSQRSSEPRQFVL